MKKNPSDFLYNMIPQYLTNNFNPFWFKRAFITLFIIFNSLTILSQTVLNGKVVRIADGDTMTILTKDNKQVRVRLYGIDCPEKGQDFSMASTRFTSQRSAGKRVTVQIKDIDRYGRTIGVVLLPDGTNLNKELLKAGLAWHYKFFDDSQEYANLEASAQKKSLGIWSLKHPIAPWDYRRAKSFKR